MTLTVLVGCFCGRTLSFTLFFSHDQDSGYKSWKEHYRDEVPSHDIPKGSYFTLVVIVFNNFYPLTKNLHLLGISILSGLHMWNLSPCGKQSLRSLLSFVLNTFLFLFLSPASSGVSPLHNLVVNLWLDRGYAQTPQAYEVSTSANGCVCR